MAVTVREIMNPELLTLRENMRADDALDVLLELEITAAPVVDEERRPVGVATLRDLLLDGIRPWVTTPALSVSSSLGIEDAARMMAESERHHLVIVGSDGRVTGLVSSYDLMRALVGLPPKFPKTFPHRDTDLDVTWTDRFLFDVEHVPDVPRDAGVIVFSAGGAGRREADLRVEEAPSLRVRVCELLEVPQGEESVLGRLLARKDLRFRCSVIADPTRRSRVVRRIEERIARAP